MPDEADEQSEASALTPAIDLNAVMHGIRTPATVIVARAQLLRRGLSRGTLTPGQCDQHAASILEAARRLEAFAGTVEATNAAECERTDR